jgi:hypothetical protein
LPSRSISVKMKVVIYCSGLPFLGVLKIVEFFVQH